MSKEKGFAAPVVIVFTIAFLLLPILFLSLNISQSKGNVKGTSDTQTSIGKGIPVHIISKQGPWDSYQYLCVNKDECTRALTSGKKIAIVSGGKTDFHTFNIEKTSDWSQYTYLKIFVVSGWLSPDRQYKVTDTLGLQGSSIETLQKDTGQVRSVLIPIAQVTDIPLGAPVIFSDE